MSEMAPEWYGNGFATKEQEQEVALAAELKRKSYQGGYEYEATIPVKLWASRFVEDYGIAGMSNSSWFPKGIRVPGAQPGMPDFSVDLVNGKKIWLEAKFSSTHENGNVVVELRDHRGYRHFEEKENRQLFYVSSSPRDPVGSWIFPASQVDDAEDFNGNPEKRLVKYREMPICKPFDEYLEELSS